METVGQIEPSLLDRPTGDILDVMNDLTAQAVLLGKSLHPRTAQQWSTLAKPETFRLAIAADCVYDIAVN